MRLKINVPEMVRALAACGQVAKRAPVNLRGKVLIADDIVAATDLESALRFPLRESSGKLAPCVVDAPGALKLFRSLAKRKLWDAELSIRGEALRWSAGIASGTLPLAMPADDYPHRVGFPEAIHFGPEGIEAEPLARALRYVLPACSDDATRSNLNGCFVEAEAEAVSITATDGHRLHRAIVSATLGLLEGWRSAILPRLPLGDLARLLKGSGELDRVRILQDPETTRVYLCADNGAWQAWMRSIDGEYPNYRQVIKKKTAYSANIDALALTGALEAVLPQAPVWPSCKISADQTGAALRIEYAHADGVSCLSIVPTHVPDGWPAASFNAQYLKDAIGGAHECSIACTDALEAFLVTPRDPDAAEGALAVVMPTRP